MATGPTNRPPADALRLRIAAIDVAVVSSADVDAHRDRLDRQQALLDRHPMAGRTPEQLVTAARKIRAHGSGLQPEDPEVTLTLDEILDWRIDEAAS